MEIAEFLRRYPPFSDLPDDRLARAARSVEIAHFPEGSPILRQDGPPADALYVIRKGAVELLDDGEPLDLLGEGEVFGQFSLLAHQSPALTARAGEDSLCYLLPEPLAAEILETEAGRSFLSSTIHKRLRAASDRVRGDVGDPRYRAVGSLVRRSTVTSEPGMTIAEAATRMADERVSCLLVPMRGSWGIVTDRDLRTRVVAARGDPGEPVETIATFPVRTVDAKAFAGDALTEMFASGVHHLPVAEEGAIVGVVTDTDLMGIGRHTPFALKSAIVRARTTDALVAAANDLPDLVVALVDVSADPVDVGRVIALVTDTLTERLVELAIDRIGEPPVAFAWLALGSSARHEQALTADQDHALALDVGGEDTSGVDTYFGELAEHVTAGLEAAGIPRCHGDAMAVHAPMRRSLDAWEARFRSWILQPTAEASVLSSIGFDYRRQAGALDAETRLDAVLRAAKDNPTFLRQLGRRALATEPPTGFFGDLVVERRGEHAGRLDIKRGGITIVTNLGRAWGIGAGSPAKDTITRLEHAAGAGVLDADVVWELADAFRFLWEVRLRHHAEQVRAGTPPDDNVDPGTLATVARSGLKEAFRVIRRAQRLLASDLGVDVG